MPHPADLPPNSAVVWQYPNQIELYKTIAVAFIKHGKEELPPAVSSEDAALLLMALKNQEPRATSKNIDEILLSLGYTKQTDGWVHKLTE